MNDVVIRFKTARFNLSAVQEHFINPCCFGEDAAAWLQTRLNDRGLNAHEPGQEDWGWYTGATLNGVHYFIGVGGNAEGGEQAPDYGEWQIMVEKRRSFWQKLRGTNRLTADDPVVTAVVAALRAEADFTDICCE